jgi:hypothetical protein
MIFQLKLKDQALVDYEQLLDIDVNVLSILLTGESLQAQWEIRLSGSANTLLREGKIDMNTPSAILAGLLGFFKASLPGLLANLKSLVNPAS